MNKLAETVASNSKARDTLRKRKGKGSRTCPGLRAVPAEVRSSKCPGQGLWSPRATARHGTDEVAEFIVHLPICTTKDPVSCRHTVCLIVLCMNTSFPLVGVRRK